MAQYKVDKGTFIKRGFSWNLQVALPTWEAFKKEYAGRVGMDLETVYNEVKKEQSKVLKPSSKSGSSKDKSKADK